MGRADRWGRVWLGPEETVYLVERGSLDVRWPGVGAVGGVDGRGEELGDDEGMPLSLQGVYACLMGRDGLSLERYVVYAGLRRSGYVVLRAPAWVEDGGDNDGIDCGEVERDSVAVGHDTEQRSWGLGLFAHIFQSLFTSKRRDTSSQGPLVTPGLYRSYSKE